MPKLTTVSDGKQKRVATVLHALSDIHWSFKTPKQTGRQGMRVTVATCGSAVLCKLKWFHCHVWTWSPTDNAQEQKRRQNKTLNTPQMYSRFCACHCMLSVQMCSKYACGARPDVTLAKL